VVGYDLVGISQVLDRLNGAATHTLRPKLDERIRLELSVGACFRNRLVMGNVVDGTIYAFDESVRSVGNLIKDMRDDAPVDLAVARSPERPLEQRRTSGGRVPKSGRVPQARGDSCVDHLRPHVQSRECQPFETAYASIDALRGNP
jgi:hypothetical protein